MGTTRATREDGIRGLPRLVSLLSFLLLLCNHLSPNVPHALDL